MAQFFLPFRPALDANALAVPGARLWFYATGTTTPQSIFADAEYVTQLTNPVVANAAGRWPPIYLDDSIAYRVVLQDRNGTTLAEADPFDGTIADSLGDDLQTIADAAIAAKIESIAASQASAISASTAASAASFTADLSQFLIVLGRYYPTYAEGIAGTTVGQLFTSDESGTIAIYKHIAGSPFYQLVPGAATVTSVDASGGTTGLSFTGGPIVSSGTLALTGTLGVANGGTGGTTATTARSALSAAKTGANSDITSLTGLTTALSVAQGGTGQTTTGGIRTTIGAAASGANTDITSLGNLTTALSIAQGGTGQTTASAALSALGGMQISAISRASASGYVRFTSGVNTFTMVWKQVACVGGSNSVTYPTIGGAAPFSSFSKAWLEGDGGGVDVSFYIPLGTGTTTGCTVISNSSTATITVFAIGA